MRAFQSLGMHVEFYVMPGDVYDDMLNGDGYPEQFSSLPIDRLNKIDV